MPKSGWRRIGVYRNLSPLPKENNHLGPYPNSLMYLHPTPNCKVTIPEEPRWVKDIWERQKGTSHLRIRYREMLCCICYLSCAEIHGFHRMYFHNDHYSRSNIIFQRNWTLKKSIFSLIAILSDPVHDIAHTTKHQIKTAPRLLLLVGLDWTQTTWQKW